MRPSCPGCQSLNFQPLNAAHRRAVERGSQHLECLTAETDNPAALALFVQKRFREPWSGWALSQRATCGNPQVHFARALSTAPHATFS